MISSLPIPSFTASIISPQIVEGGSSASAVLAGASRRGSLYGEGTARTSPQSRPSRVKDQRKCIWLTFYVFGWVSLSSSSSSHIRTSQETSELYRDPAYGY